MAMVGQKLSLPFISRVRILQRSLLGKLLTLGFDLKVEAQLDAVTLEIIKNSDRKLIEKLYFEQWLLKNN